MDRYSNGVREGTLGVVAAQPVTEKEHSCNTTLAGTGMIMNFTFTFNVLGLRSG